MILRAYGTNWAASAVEFDCMFDPLCYRFLQVSIFARQVSIFARQDAQRKMYPPLLFLTRSCGLDNFYCRICFFCMIQY